MQWPEMPSSANHTQGGMSGHFCRNSLFKNVWHANIHNKHCTNFSVGKKFNIIASVDRLQCPHIFLAYQTVIPTAISRYFIPEVTRILKIFLFFEISPHFLSLASCFLYVCATTFNPFGISSDSV